MKSENTTIQNEIVWFTLTLKGKKGNLKLGTIFNIIYFLRNGESLSLFVVYKMHSLKNIQNIRRTN